MSRRRGSAALVVSALAALLVAAVSNRRVHPPGEGAVLRLSWRTQPVRMDECRRLTEEELNRLPAHMRRPEVCDGRFADYRLQVTLDGREVLVDTIRPSGVRRDRPVYVLEEMDVAPGPHDVVVDFIALLPDSLDAATLGASFGWRGEVALGPRQIGLITMNAEADTLERR